MATFTVRVQAAQGESGMTVKLFNLLDDTLIGQSAVAVETTLKGTYTALFTVGLLPTGGVYRIENKASDGTTNLGDQFVDLASVAEAGSYPAYNNLADVRQAEQFSRSGFLMAAVFGTISNADSATEEFAITLDGVTYTATGVGLDESGNRTSVTLVES